MGILGSISEKQMTQGQEGNKEKLQGGPMLHKKRAVILHLWMLIAIRIALIKWSQMPSLPFEKYTEKHWIFEPVCHLSTSS
jgi:hypothetical protein